MEIRRTTKFKKSFRKFPEWLKQKSNRQILLLVKSPHHPSLRVEKVKSEKGVWEATVTKGYRFTFQRISEDIILLRRIGEHDKVLKNP